MTWCCLFALAACGGAKLTPPPPGLTAGEWVKRCTHHIEVANIALARIDPIFDEAETTFDASVFNPIVNVRVVNENDVTMYAGRVAHGHRPCNDVVRTSKREPAWTEGHRTDRLLFRYREPEDDAAWIEAFYLAPPATAETFAFEMQRAFDACLVDARRVQLPARGKDFTCGGT